MKISTLELKEAHRDMTRTSSDKRIAFLDYVIGDIPMQNVHNYDYITPLGGHWYLESEIDYLHQVLLEKPSELPDGRIPLFVCPECGDLGCGTLTVQIEINDVVKWHSFGWQNNYDFESLEIMQDFGPFYFKKADYFDLFNSLILRLTTSSQSQPVKEES